LTFLTTAATAAALSATFLGAAPVQAQAQRPPTLCVGGQASCFETVQEAVDAARPGARVTVAAGTYTGGVTIDKDLSLVGAGASTTVLRGGGPVLTIGVDQSPHPPTVTITGLTITGGKNTSVPEASLALGGGVLIPPGAGGAPGATVTIRDSVISRNTAQPRGVDDCGFPCSFALGGGISNYGRLTVIATRVVDNVVGPSSSHVFGGGIFNADQGELVLRSVTLSGNVSAATGPLSRVAEAGGVYSTGQLVVDHGTVTANIVRQSSSLPIDIDHVANGGGIAFHGRATIRDTVIRANEVVATNTAAAGFTNAFGGGLVVKGVLDLVRSTLSGNEVRVTSRGQAIAEAGGMSVDLTTATVRDSLFVNNRAVARGRDAVQANGGGIYTLGTVTLSRSIISGNEAQASGGAGVFPWGEASMARGGGIVAFHDQDPGSQLRLTDSVVTRNSATGAPGISTAGGGIHSAPDPVTLIRTLVRGNAPDQCVGCVAAAPVRPTETRLRPASLLSGRTDDHWFVLQRWAPLN
ncbi:MAG: hypothetical protein ABI890_18680, partial [Lapillicoccus sp.]